MKSKEKNKSTADRETFLDVMNEMPGPGKSLEQIMKAERKLQDKEQISHKNQP